MAVFSEMDGGIHEVTGGRGKSSAQERKSRAPYDFLQSARIAAKTSSSAANTGSNNCGNLPLHRFR
jgi:hypothetical protein